MYRATCWPGSQQRHTRCCPSTSCVVSRGTKPCICWPKQWCWCLLAGFIFKIMHLTGVWFRRQALQCWLSTLRRTPFVAHFNWEPPWQPHVCGLQWHLSSNPIPSASLSLSLSGIVCIFTPGIIITVLEASLYGRQMQRTSGLCVYVPLM